MRAGGGNFRSPKLAAMSTTGRAAYGPLAERYARCFSESYPVVVFDQAGAAEALLDCAARKFRNETFFVRAIVPREYTIRTDAVAPSILASFKSLEERRTALDQAFDGTLQTNNQLLRDIGVYPPAALRLMQGAIRLSDGLVASSESERRRVQEILGTDPPAFIEPLADQGVPTGKERVNSVKRDAIVIWAPNLSGDASLVFALALAELRYPLLLVTAAPPQDASLGYWFPPEQAHEALSRAKLVVDTSSHGCDAALPLASWNVPIIADIESGAHETLERVRTYDRRRMASIFEAAVSELGSLPACARPTSSQRQSQPQTDPLVLDGPLVSIIIQTYDRPEMLRDALESIARQTYRNIETVVVVDGGPHLDAKAFQFDNVRFINMPENDSLASSNTAFAATRGEYICILNDDDVYFPNHVAHLVSALERSGAAVAHADVLTAFLRTHDNQWLLYGLESNMNRATDRSSLMVSNQIGLSSCMFRRSCISDNVLVDGDVPLYRDYALWVRLVNGYDFLHVERITSCYTIRNRGAQQQSTLGYDKALRSYQVIYEKYPVPNRPMLQRRREQTLQSVVQGGVGLGTEPAGTVRPTPWPLWNAAAVKN